MFGGTELLEIPHPRYSLHQLSWVAVYNLGEHNFFRQGDFCNSTKIMQDLF